MLVLRAAEDQDIAGLHALYSDPRAMRYWSSLPHQSPQETRRVLDHLWQDGPRRYFLVALDGRAIGTCGVHSEDEIGFIFHPDTWGQGLAQEAVAAVIQHVWATTDLPRLTADADPRNRASVGLLTRLGFEVSGYATDTFCIGGAWSDSAYFSLKRPAGP